MVETLRYRQETNLTTSEAARDWTECSPNSKLVDIANKLAHYNWEDGDELRSLIEKREYKKFQSKIWINNPKDLDGKLWLSSFRFLCNYVKKQRREIHEVRRNNQALSSLQESIRTWGNPNESVETKLNRAAQRYLSKYETLPEDVYNRLFSGKEAIQQWQAKNCYLVAWLMEIANSQYFDTLMRTSITRVQFKADGALWYNIKIPLWEPNGRDILIKDSELSSAKIIWNIWYKLLEIAYVKNRRPNSKAWNKYAPVTEEEYKRTAGWWMKEVFDTFLWKSNINFNTFWDKMRATPLRDIPQNQLSQLVWFLQNYNPSTWDKYVSLSSLWWKSDRRQYTVWQNPTPINFGHAYCLSSVDKDSNGKILQVNLTNPRNDKYSWWPWLADISLSLPEFLAAFSYISVWHIKADTFLDDNWISLA